jgi:Zn-dependent peptidase ImmA (M78 family)
MVFARRERLLPATNSRTRRQKFQRVFAQEFLCPLDIILEHVGKKQTDENIVSFAKEYNVSPRLVATALVNTGNASRELLKYF